jgi:hypothetical protein
LPCLYFWIGYAELRFASLLRFARNDEIALSVLSAHYKDVVATMNAFGLAFRCNDGDNVSLQQSPLQASSFSFFTRIWVQVSQ